MEIGNSMKPKKPKPSAVRDFPPGCGRYASPIAIPTAQNATIATPTAVESSARSRVREALSSFQALCTKFLQEEGAHYSNGDAGVESAPFRVDLKAAKVLRDKKMYVNAGKQIVGNVPGIEVGDQFHYRIELSIVGLHRPLQAGIDFLKQGRLQVATSIVASGGYEDDVDNGDVLVYTGHGGNNYSGNRRQSDHQKLERGNLALKNCLDENVPVRVIRGIKHRNGAATQGKGVMVYRYDGLYDVEKYWQERGASGYAVFKFQLRRQPGQPTLDFTTVEFVGRDNKYLGHEDIPSIDISQGKEARSICVVNTVDDEVGPPPFEYITNVMYPSWLHPSPPKGCDCNDGCLDPTRCFCFGKNGGEFPFDFNGAIVEHRRFVYECGPSCSCPSTCHNRVCQYGVRFNLEVFNTEDKGWGVRSFDPIPSGSFVCEYIGEVLLDVEVEQRIMSDEYLFDIGSNSEDRALCCGPSSSMLEVSWDVHCGIGEDVCFTIDANRYGNVGRFVNHSCSPNLFVQNVLYDHDDKKLSHIMLFATKNIPPLQELTYHYNFIVDQGYDSNDKKKKYCSCGSSKCIARM
eukprot:Gb_11902 [translate_table: standard]